MDKQEQQQLIKETVAHAKNAWGVEDSKIAGMILEKMKGHIETAVDTKIKPLSDKLDHYIVDDTTWKETFVKDIKKWQDQAMPVLEAGTKALNFGSVGMGILKFFGVLGGAVAVVYAFFKWIK